MRICVVQILEKKAANEYAIKSASALKDPLSSFPGFSFYTRDGKLSDSRSDLRRCWIAVRSRCDSSREEFNNVLGIKGLENFIKPWITPILFSELMIRQFE